MAPPGAPLMQTADLLVLVLYVAGVVWLGARCSRRQRSIRDYFLTGRQVPWWALLGSIVATETSTITLISVPGYAFGADLTFLQLALGYVVARVLVALLLLPAFFRSELLTIHQLLTARFGSAAGRAAASLFLTTRSLSDGLRLFATGLVLAAVLATVPGVEQLAGVVAPALDSSTALLVAAIAIVAAATLLYTLLGGMLAVVWADVAQLVVYLAGALLAGSILLAEIPGGWAEVTARAGAAGKLRLFDFALDLSRSYTFWSGLVGGAFITAATHGADQLLVQRYLCCRSAADARRALVASGFVVLVQFWLLLLIGLMLWTYYTAHDPAALAAVSSGGQVQTDRVFPLFITSHLPTGVKGLVVAAMVAAAMSTLSSSLNSSAASTVGDFYVPLTRGALSDRHYLQAARWATVGWGAVQVLVALAAIALSQRVVDEALGIQSFTGGLLLGALSLCFLRTRAGAAAPIAGLAAGAAVLLAVRAGTDISWQWYALIGSVTTYAAGRTVSALQGDAPAAGSRR